jgi:hypothetical protein
MVSLEAVMLICVIDTLEDQDIAVIDIFNAFVQTVIEDEEPCVVVCIRGPLGDILVSIAPDVYDLNVSTNKAGQKVLLVQYLNAVYRTMVAALLYYNKFVKSLTKQGYKINLFDGCMVNKVVKGKQVTICFHINDCKIYHKSFAVIDNTVAWLRTEYESIFEDGSGQMKVHWGKTHKYFGMSLDFSHKGQCQGTMHDHIDKILQAYDLAIKNHNYGYQIVEKRHAKTCAAPNKLFVVNENYKKLSNEAAAAFHTIVAKALYVTKRARPDISLAIAFLTTRVRSPIIEDWEKLRQLMEYLRVDRERPLILGADTEGMLMWYVNASSAVHLNRRRHTGGGMTMGRNFPISVSTKQNLNTKSSTESELVGIDNMMPIILWTCYVLLSQGYGVIKNLLLQDNKSLVLLERNGKASSGKCTRHINIRYFFITDPVNMKELTIKWCPTKQMVADFMTKLIQGSHFKHLRDYIMGRVCSSMSCPWK